MQVSVAVLAHLAAVALGGGLTVYSLAALTVLVLRLVIVARNRPRIGRAAPYSVIVPAYNEDPDTLLACLRSILGQSVSPGAVVVIDDGSARDLAAVAEEARAEFEAAGVRFIAERRETNQGKRHALVRGRLLAPEATVLVCVDSDTELDPGACAALVGAFADRRVKAATGKVLARNRSANLLTRLIDARYVGAFEFDRASQSALGGSMVCACGSLAAYRGSMVDHWAGDFLGQTFGGRECTFGDDRRLTAYALRSGRSVYVREAVAYTDVPERFVQFTRQQIRWARSWSRESLLALREISPRRWGWWMVLAETVTWAAFTAGLLVSLTHPDWRLVHLAEIAAVALSRTGAYLHRRDLSLGQRLAGMAVTPLYSVINLWVLLPLRCYALCTMTNNGWGTRQASTGTQLLGEMWRQTPRQARADRGKVGLHHDLVGLALADGTPQREAGQHPRHRQPLAADAQLGGEHLSDDRARAGV